MCVCVHANSPEGYLHLSRFAWPYSSLHPSFSSLPDYTVVDEGVWGNGLGGVLLAGYWGADWEYVLSDTYIWQTPITVAALASIQQNQKCMNAVFFRINIWRTANLSYARSYGNYHVYVCVCVYWPTQLISYFDQSSALLFSSCYCNTAKCVVKYLSSLCFLYYNEFLCISV